MKTSFDFAAAARQSVHYLPAGIQRIECQKSTVNRERAGQIEAAPSSPTEAVRATENPTMSPVRPTPAPAPAPAHTNDASESSAAVVCTQPVMAAASTPRFNVFASTNVAFVVSVAAIVARWFVHSGWACALVSLSPLWLLLWREQRAMRSLYAGVLWLGLAWLRLVHPASSAGSSLQDLLSLCVLAIILLSLRDAYKGMQELSRRDPLTGLLNRRGFEELGKVEVLRATRYARPIAFALLDVDRFKQINDQHGHAVGDRVLQLVAAQLSELRNSDLAVRLGGDEFGLLMPETDAAGAEVLVSRLAQRVAERTAEEGWPVTISAGIADSQNRARHIDALIAAADRYMYEAKAVKHGPASTHA